MAPAITIIILNWNGYQDTISCIESCLQISYPAFRILIVDNGSSDNSETLLRKRFPDIEIVQTGSNLGFAGGNNVGIRHALATGADYIWLLNNDTLVEANTLTELVKVAENCSAAGMVGSKILFYDHPNTIWFAGGFWSPDGANIRHRGYGEIDSGQYDEPCRTDFLTGCSLLIRANIIQQIGLLREEYFLYWEDADWCRTAVENGWELYYAPASMVWHKVSASVRDKSKQQWYYYTRNACLFIEQHVRKKLLSHLLNHQWYYLNKSLREKKWPVFWGICSGLRDYIFRRFGARWR